MASIRRKNDKWQAVIRRAGEATIARSFRSKTDARKWAIAVEQRLDQGECGQINKAALNDSLGLIWAVMRRKYQHLRPVMT